MQRAAGGRKVLSKSEKKANDTLKQWLEGPAIDSDEFDTDLEDDFPPTAVPPSDNTGKYIYQRHCLKTGAFRFIFRLATTYCAYCVNLPPDLSGHEHPLTLRAIYLL